MWLLFNAALALEPATCPPAEALLPGERWLRAVSLDIRGVIPSEDDYQQITSADELPEALIDDWLDTDEFAHRVARHHRDHQFCTDLNIHDEFEITTSAVNFVDTRFQILGKLGVREGKCAVQQRIVATGRCGDRNDPAWNNLFRHRIVIGRRETRYEQHNLSPGWATDAGEVSMPRVTRRGRHQKAGQAGVLGERRLRSEHE